MLPEGLPPLTLGWQILDWGSAMLAQPDGDTQGDAWVYNNDQARFVLWFYAIDEFGKFIYRDAVVERPKGSGKSPLMAALVCTELMGPVKFNGFDSNGQPVGVMANSPTIQVAAVSESQTDSTLVLVREMLGGGEIYREFPQLDIQLSKITHPGGRSVQRVTASPKSQEGKRPDFAVFEEIQHWVSSNKGDTLYEALKRNMMKRRGRSVSATNAFMPGEESVAETLWSLYSDFLSGDGPDPRILYDTKEVYVEDLKNKSEMMAALDEVYGDAWWIDKEELFLELLTTKEVIVRRFFLNQKVITGSNWLDETAWNSCEVDKIKLKKTDQISLGFKGNVRKGAAIIACRLTDGALFNLGWWENPGLEGWEVDAAEVDRKMRKILDTYNVEKLFCDPSQYRDIWKRLYADYPDVVEEFWLSTKVKYAKSVEQFEAAVIGKRLCYGPGCEDLSKHVIHCYTEETANGYILRQETRYTTKYIFGAQAAVIALEAATAAIEDGALSKVDSLLYTF